MSAEATQPPQERVVVPLPTEAREMDPALRAALSGGPIVHEVDDTPGMPTKTFRDLTSYYSREIAELKAEVANLREQVAILKAQRTGVAKILGSVLLELVRDDEIKTSLATSIVWAVKGATVAGGLALLVAVGVTQLTYKDGTLSFTGEDAANEELAVPPTPAPVTVPPDIGTSPDP